MNQSTNPNRTAAIYVRVSTQGQEDEGTSLASQEAACRAYAAEQGYTVAAVYREVHTGADLFERRELSALRETVRRGEVGVIVAYALDRLSRNQAHLGLILSETEHARASLEFVAERLDDTPEGRLVQSVQAYAGELERLKTLERTMRGKRARAASGRPLPGCKAPYGYRWADPAPGAKTRLEPNDEEAAVVRRIFHEAVTGASIRGIALGLTDDGIPSPSGNARWGTSTIPEILKLPTYVGEYRAFRKRCEKVRGRSHKVTLRPDGEQVALPPDVAPALVDKAIQEAALARLARNKAESVRTNANPEATLLRAGFARCGYCGHPLRTGKSSTGHRVYRCNNPVRAKACPNFTIAATVLDHAVWARVEAVLLQPDIIAAEVERQRHANPADRDLTALDGRIAEIEAGRQRAARAVVALDDDEAAAPLIAQLTALAKQKQALEAERTAVAALQAGWEADQARIADLATWCQRVAGNLPTLSYAAKRDALTALGVEARVWRVDHTPRWEVIMRLDDLLAAPTVQQLSSCW